MRVKHSVSFFLNKTKGKPYAPLRCRIRWCGNAVAVNIGYSVTIDYWEQTTSQCMRRTLHGKDEIPAQVINKAIADAEKMIHIVFDDFSDRGIVPTEEDLRHEINVRTGKEREDTSLFAHYDAFLNSSQSWSESTWKKLNTIKTHLQEFNSNLSFADFDAKIMDRLISFFIKIGHSNVTIKKNINAIKWFYRWAVNQELCEPTSFLSIKPKLPSAQKPVIFLSWDELMRVYHYDFSNTPRLDAVRDVFCFCAFTSLRYSDVANLTASNIHDDHISVTTIKTHDTLRIDLNNYSKAIISKYADIGFPNGKYLPIISAQRTNEYLKEIAVLCEINEPVQLVTFIGNKRTTKSVPKHELLTTHAGRRTFICNALMLGIPPDIVMKWTGHSDYKAMKPYIDITDEAKKNAMDLFNQKMTDNG